MGESHLYVSLNIEDKRLQIIGVYYIPSVNEWLKAQVEYKVVLSHIVSLRMQS